VLPPIATNIYEHLAQLLHYRPKDPHKLFEKLPDDREVSIDDSTFAKNRLAILSVFLKSIIIILNLIYS
jgi:hypothetical protein